MDLQDALNLDDLNFEGGASTDFGAGLDWHAPSAGTISPQDLFIAEFSAPNSAALTNLTSPSIYNESPEFPDGTETSPLFGPGDFDNGSNTNAQNWFSLFPQENAVPETVAPAVEDSPAQQPQEPEVQPKPRRKSANSPGGGSGRHSSVSGVNPRRRDKPLPPITVDDPNDTVAMKRARNTLAARKSRERKVQKFEDLEETIAKLTAERDHWKKLALARGEGS